MASKTELAVRRLTARSVAAIVATMWVATVAAGGHRPQGPQSPQGVQGLPGNVEHWVGTWATADVGRPQAPPAPVAPIPSAPGQRVAIPPAPFLHFNNQTLRQVVHTSVGGSRARVVLSNTFGTTPLTIGAVHLAVRNNESTIVPSSDRALTFGARPTVTIPAGALVVSDPADFAVPLLADVVIDVYLPGDTNTPSPLTEHGGAFQTSYVSEPGNFAGRATLPVSGTTRSWFLLSRLEVRAPAAAGAVVAFGDSITDGARSSLDSNHRWPNRLAARLQTETAGAKLAVMNAGIGGNRLLSEGTFGAGMNALSRFDRDALDQPGVTDVIVLEGINDIGQARQEPTPTAQDLIAAHEQLIERAHTRGVRIYGGTLTPFEGAGYFTAEGEAKRQALNDWIRTSHAYDGVIDFDLATRDPDHPTRFLALYDSGDHLHPNDAGYEAMGNAIDIGLFTAPSTRTSRRR